MTDRKTQIQHAALSIFTRYGLRRASMQDVAREAGLSRPALYQYFRNKEDLIANCVDMVTDEGVTQAEAAISGEADQVNRITTYLSTHMIYYHRLLISGPHSDDVLAIKNRYGDTKIDAVRKNLITRLNEMAGLDATDHIGAILADGAEGLKLQAPDEATLDTQIKVLVKALVPAQTIRPKP